MLGHDSDFSYSKDGIRLGELNLTTFIRSAIDFKRLQTADKIASISYKTEQLADTTNWNLFTDSKKHYQIRYPNNWEVKQKEFEGYYSDYQFKGPNGDLITIGTHNALNINMIKNQISITVAGLPAVEGFKTEDSLNPKNIIIVVLITEPVNGVYYDFRYVEKDKNNVYAYLPVFNALVKSFSITQQP